MKKYQWSLFLFAGILISTLANAQQRRPAQLELNYVVGIPTGQFRDITDKVSGRGVELALLFPVGKNLSLGVQGGYQDFYKRFPRAVFHEPGSDLSAVVTNSVQVSPIMLKAQYAFNGPGNTQPYASLAAGGNFVTYSKYYGQFVEQRSNFGFAAQPELGIHIPFKASGKSGFHVAAGYNFMPFEGGDAKGLHHAVIKAGLRFSLQQN